MKISILILLFITTPLYAAKNNTSPPYTIESAHQEFKEGTLTATKLVEFYLDRIQKIDDSGIALNSVVQINGNALIQAKSLDIYYQKHGLKGPLHGIPVLLKDNIDTLDGMANTAGSAALRYNYPKKAAFVVLQLEQAGAIILGKTNLSEWANFRSTHSSSGWSGLYGQARNPYDPTTSPCGSSSGSGIAVAANLAILAVGTETDGSVTCPASVNGIVGIKPTLGTISRSGIIPLAHSQDTAGPMARTVTDAVIMLQAMIGFDKKDKQALKTNTNFIKHLKKSGLKGKRIGIVRNLSGYLPQVDKEFEQALKDLKAQGAILVDNTNIKQEWDDAEFEVLLYEFKADINHYLAKTAVGIPKSLSELITFNNDNATQEMPYFGQEIFLMAQEKQNLMDKNYIKALKTAKNKSKQAIDELIEKYNLDILVAPTTGPAWKTDWVNGDHYLGSASSPAAVSGYPHITVPMGNIHGLPIGLSFFGTQNSEGTLIEAAYGYEQATHHRIEPNL